MAFVMAFVAIPAGFQVCKELFHGKRFEEMFPPVYESKEGGRV